MSSGSEAEGSRIGLAKAKRKAAIYRRTREGTSEGMIRTRGVKSLSNVTSKRSSRKKGNRIDNLEKTNENQWNSEGSYSIIAQCRATSLVHAFHAFHDACGEIAIRISMLKHGKWVWFWSLDKLCHIHLPVIDYLLSGEGLIKFR